MWLFSIPMNMRAPLGRRWEFLRRYSLTLQKTVLCTFLCKQSYCSACYSELYVSHSVVVLPDQAADSCNGFTFVSTVSCADFEGDKGWLDCERQELFLTISFPYSLQRREIFLQPFSCGKYTSIIAALTFSFNYLSLLALRGKRWRNGRRRRWDGRWWSTNKLVSL